MFPPEEMDMVIRSVSLGGRVLHEREAGLISPGALTCQTLIEVAGKYVTVLLFRASCNTDDGGTTKKSVQRSMPKSRVRNCATVETCKHYEHSVIILRY